MCLGEFLERVGRGRNGRKGRYSAGRPNAVESSKAMQKSRNHVVDVRVSISLKEMKGSEQQERISTLHSRLTPVSLSVFTYLLTEPLGP